jgi:hypothetical protein
MIRLFYFLFLPLLLSSCSLSFNREWKSAIKTGPYSGTVEGAWEGTWKSDVNGHNGRLRSVVGPVKNAEGEHSFHYHATWAKILSGGYRADHRVRNIKGVFVFQGQHKLPGWAGGLYTYEGTVNGDDFEARYECDLDKGTFRMKRVK